MDEEIRQALTEVREMKQMCGNINMKLTNIVTQRGQDIKKKLEAEYQRGLDDAWAAARKIVKMPDPPYWGVFDEYKDDLFRKITATEAIAKLKAYEEKQQTDDKIKVGDFVKPCANGTSVIDPFVVTKVSDDHVWGICADGSWNYWEINDVIKTDKHFDIEKILEEMRT